MKRILTIAAALGLAASVLGCGVMRGGRSPGPEPDPAPVDASDRALMELRKIDQSAHPDAVCNDGSTPVFYVRPGTGDGARKWLVFLKGGGACGDRETCTKRGPVYTSNKPWLGRPTIGIDDAGGIMDPDPKVNPDFYTWNHVFIPYCSSDFWMGDRAASAATFDMHFRGVKIVDAVLDALEDESIVGDNDLSDATDLLLSGSSAGAIGVIQHADRLDKRFADLHFAALADAGFNADTDAVDLHDPYDLWNPMIDPDCTSKVKNDWECLEGFVMLQNEAVQANLFVQQSQFDPNAMSGLRPNNPADREKASQLVDRLIDVMEDQDGAFCSGTPGHMAIDHPIFATLEVDGTTLAKAVGDWYFDRGGNHKVIERGAEMPDGPPNRGGDGARTPGGRAGKMPNRRGR